MRRGKPKPPLGPTVPCPRCQGSGLRPGVAQRLAETRSLHGATKAVGGAAACDLCFGFGRVSDAGARKD
jgi:hypothetical protein